MVATTDTDQALRPLSMPELLTIASVIVGRMDQSASCMPHLQVDVDANVHDRPGIRLFLDQRPGKASHSQGVAFLGELSQAIGAPVTDRPDFHIESVYCLNWEGTGIQVSGQAAVRAENSS